MTDQNRRFTGTQSLYGQTAFEKFRHTHAYVIGVGGVGSWLAEALARTGIGHISLIDMDVLVESNVNRQLPALDSTFGASKIGVMGERIAQINPDCQVVQVDEFLTKDNVTDLLPSRSTAKALAAQGKTVLIFDCTDDMNAKLTIALHCRFNKLKLITAGAAGAKTDPTQLTVSDLKDVYQDPLLAKLREKLKEKNINKAQKEKFGIKCVFSSEPPKKPTVCNNSLNCGGYGSAVVITCTIAMMMVAEGLKMVK